VDTSERRPGLRSLAGPVGRITRPLLRRRGLANAQMVAKWRDIIGEALASQSIPQRYVPDRQGGGTLHIRVGGAWAIEFQHLEPQIVERINGFFGYRAVTRLALIQGPVAKVDRGRPVGGPPTGRHADPIETGTVADIRDDELRQAFEQLATAIRSRQTSDKKS